MSGHSKWSKVKHQKGVTDAIKGKIFTKMANAIAISVRESGNADPETNFKLRLAIEKARSMNMPKSNIDRAIARGSGEDDGARFETVVYEAFAPEGVGMIVEAATDNKQRTVSILKNTLDRHGGTLAAQGAVSHLFRYVGFIEVDKSGKSFDSLMDIALNVGAEDIQDAGTSVDIYTKPTDLHKVKESLVKEGITVTDAELIYQPIAWMSITDPNKVSRLQNLLETIEDLDDVQKVFANCDFPGLSS